MMTVLLLTALALISILALLVLRTRNHRLARLLPVGMCLLTLIFALTACGNGK